MTENPLQRIHDFTFYLNPDARILFLTMLMRCEKDGEVLISRPILASQAGLSKEQFEKALEELMTINPKDLPYPRVIKTSDPLKNTYTVNNYAFYRDDLVKKCYREWMRDYMSRRRNEKNKQNNG